MNTKDTLLDILNDIDDSIDWKEQKGLVDERILDSFCVITLISDLEDAYGVEIEAAEMIPENCRCNLGYDNQAAGETVRWHTINLHTCFCFCRSSF